MFAVLLVLLIAFDYDFIVYAREPVSFSHTYSESYYAFNSQYGSASLAGYVRLVLTYDDLVTYLGTVPGDSLTLTVTGYNVNSYSNKSSSGKYTTVNFYDAALSSSSGTITCTPAGGGEQQVTDFTIGKEVNISYGGGNITFDILPAIYIGATADSFGALYYIVDSTWFLSFPAAPLSDNEALNQLVDNQEQYRQEDRDNATQAGEDAGGLVEEMQSLKEKWSILWYPIEFTQQLLQVFTGGSSSRAYIAKYYNVEGYTYNEETGYLEPIRNPVMTIAAAQAESGGATITFPSYTLPVLDIKLWDAYTFDLTMIKDSFPALFDALYVISTVIEMYLFVGFLRDKFEEVFG